MQCMVPATDSNLGLIAQMRRGALEFCVMALLEHDERYGLDLVQALEAAGGLVTSEGTIYPLLSRLRRDGLVDTNWRESSSGPPRRYYRLSAAGQNSLASFRDEWARFSKAVDRVLARGKS